MWPVFARLSAEWSSSRFSLRSTAQTCQPLALRAMSSASGAKYAALADVPGFRTRMFFALFGPTFRTPTLLYFAGVPGDLKPASHFEVLGRRRRGGHREDDGDDEKEGPEAHGGKLP